MTYSYPQVHPYQSHNGSQGHNLFDGGAGYVTRLVARDAGRGVARISWQARYYGSHSRATAAAYVYADRRYHARVQDRDHIDFAIPLDRESVLINVLLFPVDRRYESWPWFARDCRGVRLSWTTGARTRRVRVRRETGGAVSTGSELLAELGDFEARTESAGLTLSGSWSGPQEAGTIELEAVGDGTEYLFDYGGETFGPRPFGTIAAHLLHGIAVRFGAESYAAGTQWAIQIGLPEEYETGDLADGDHHFAIGAVNECGDETLSAETVETVDGRPSDPELVGYEYAPGSGVVTTTWRAPSEADVIGAYGYRSWPGRDYLNWGAIERKATSPGATYTHTVAGLVAGVNLIGSRTIDAGERLSEGEVYFEMELDGDLNELGGGPNAPAKFEASLSGCDVLVAIAVDETAQSVNVYGGSSPGAIDYGASLLQVTTPGRGPWTFRRKITGLADGTWWFVARASAGATEEGNTEARGPIELDGTAAEAAAGVESELVCA